MNSFRWGNFRTYWTYCINSEHIICAALKRKNICSHNKGRKTKNNGVQRILLSSVGDDKDGNGLKLDGGQYFRVLRLCLEKMSKNSFQSFSPRQKSFDIFLFVFQEHFVYMHHCNTALTKTQPAKQALQIELGEREARERARGKNRKRFLFFSPRELSCFALTQRSNACFAV